MATAVSSTTGTPVTANSISTTGQLSNNNNNNTQKMNMPSRSQKPAQRKKKAARACIHCQKVMEYNIKYYVFKKQVEIN